MLFALLMILLMIMPAFFLSGVSGAFFRPLALSTVLAVVTSLVVALIITPALSYILFANARRAPSESPIFRGLKSVYGRILAGVIRHRGVAYGVLGVMLLAGLVSIPFLRQESLLPTFKEPDLTIQWEGAPGTSRPAMERIAARASNELRTIPGVKNVGVHVGRAVSGDQVVGISSAQLWVSIDPAADYDATVAAIQETVDGYVGLGHEVRTYLQHTLREVLTGGPKAMVARVYGENPEILSSKAEEIRQALTGIDGIVELEVEHPLEEPTLEIQVDLAAAQRQGVKPGDVRRAAATLLSGLQVGSLFEEQKVFDVVVWSTPNTRSSLTGVNDLLIDTPSGGHVRLGQVAKVNMTSSQKSISREGASHFLDVSFNVQGRNLAAVARDVHQVIGSIEYPLEYHAEVIGEYAELQTAQQRIFLAVIIAVIGVYLLLQAALSSWRTALVVFLTVPVAVSGGVVAMLIAGRNISLGSMVGLLTIVMLAVRNGIMLMRHYQRLEDEEGMAFSSDLILRGSRERMAPMVITALVTACALAPYAFAGSIPGNELIQPLAIVVLGGLITLVSLDLFVLPVLYLRLGYRSEAVRSPASEFAVS
jgi:Cu/Ag efflux pump CusA